MLETDRLILPDEYALSSGQTLMVWYSQAFQLSIDLFASHLTILSFLINKKMDVIIALICLHNMISYYNRITLFIKKGEFL